MGGNDMLNPFTDGSGSHGGRQRRGGGSGTVTRGGVGLTSEEWSS
jgi:hypothetical protein